MNNRRDQNLSIAQSVVNIGMDVSMVAGVGRRPLAQVLRNSLSVHPPTTGHKTIFEENTVTQALGVGTQDTNCEAPERASLNSWRSYIACSCFRYTLR